MLLSRAMRKRCSSLAESRQPLKTLKSVGPRSSLNGLPRAAKIARVRQLQEGEVIEGQSVFSAPLEYRVRKNVQLRVMKTKLRWIMKL